MDCCAGMKTMGVFIVLVASSLSLAESAASEMSMRPTNPNKDSGHNGNIFDGDHTTGAINPDYLSQPARNTHNIRGPEAAFYPDALAPTNSDQLKPARLAKRAPEMGSSGFYGDAFNNGFGSFDTMRRRRLETTGDGGAEKRLMIEPDSQAGTSASRQEKRLRYRPINQFSRSLHRSANRSFGAFKRHMLGASGFYGDAFHGGLGAFETMRKRRPLSPYNQQLLFWLLAPGGATNGEKRSSMMGSSAFYGDAFNGGMGTFDTM